MKRSISIIFIFILYLPLIASAQSDDSDKKAMVMSGKFLVSKLKPLAELVISDQPSVENAVKLLGGNPKTYEKERCVSIKDLGFSVLLSLDRSGKTDSITAIHITTELDMDIEFHRDIEPLFGRWEELGKGSKYPGATFTYLNSRTGKTATVGVRLYWPAKTRVCPVVRIVIFSDQAAAENKFR